MIQKRFLLLILLLFSQFVDAQLSNSKNPDSLLVRNYDYLSHAILIYKKDTVKSWVYAQTWLKKAKADKDFKQLALGYKATLYLANKNTWAAYADSMVVAAKKTKNNILIGTAYLTKATVYFGQKDNKNALDNFLLADEYISKTDDSYSIYKVKYCIAQTKYYLGFYDEAVSLFRECINYFKEENDRAYLNSVHGLGICYNKIGKYDLCSAANQLGLIEGRRLGNLEMEAYFIQSEGINQYFKNNYSKAIKDLTATLQDMRSNKDFANETVGHFYLGKCYWSINEKEKGIAYFKKVDTAFDQKKYTRPDLREGYELLIDYYKKHNDTKSQLYYINQLLKVDNILGQNYKYLLTKIVKEYDTKELLKSKQDIENAMTFRTMIAFSIISVLLGIIIFLVYRHFKNKRLFKEIMNRDTTKLVVPKNIDKQTTQDISPDIETDILKNLEKFEHSKKYLEKDMNLVKMAKLLNTNSKYVTKIIAKHRDKGTIEYITDLKIDHIIELLKTHNKFRYYTNKALAEEVGFGSTQNFTRAFNQRTGLSPTYFVEELKKSFPL